MANIIHMHNVSKYLYTWISILFILLFRILHANTSDITYLILLNSHKHKFDLKIEQWDAQGNHFILTVLILITLLFIWHFLFIFISGVAVSFRGNNAGQPGTRNEPISLSTLDRDCFIIPVHSLDRFLPAGIPVCIQMYLIHYFEDPFINVYCLHLKLVATTAMWFIRH